MVRKLFKHEFLALLRWLFPVECAVLALGIFTRILMFFEIESPIFDLVSFSTWAVFIIVIFIAFLATTVFAVIRYYKNLFTNEGYLSFTLPVSSTEHILVKAVTAVSFDIITIIVSFISFSVAVSGNLFGEITKAINYAFSVLAEKLSIIAVVIIVLEFLVFWVLSLFYKYFIFYSCITIGQMAKKHRIFAAIGVYFIYYAINWVISTIMQIVLFVSSASPHFLTGLAEAFKDNPDRTIQIVLLVYILGILVLNVALFFINRFIITKKLNLE